MALSPLKPQTDRARPNDQTIASSKTYALDIDRGRIGGMIDGLDAVRQFVRKTLATARYRFMVYGEEYGCEAEDLIGANLPDPLLETEIPRVIREALIYDDRIYDVTGFELQRMGDAMYVTFTVETVAGVLDEGVKLNVR